MKFRYFLNEICLYSLLCQHLSGRPVQKLFDRREFFWTSFFASFSAMEKEESTSNIKVFHTTGHFKEQRIESRE